MSSKPANPSDSALNRAAVGPRNAALRLAFGVTACFAVVEALDWDVTFLAPLLAANMLVKSPRPPSLAQGLVVVILFAASIAAVLLLSTLVISKPEVLILALMLLLYLSFYAHRRGAPDLATLLPQISAVSLPIGVAVLSPDGARAFAGTLGDGRLRCAAHRLGSTRGRHSRTCGPGGRGGARHRHLIGQARSGDARHHHLIG